MSADLIVYQRSDAWLLLSVLYASRKHQASLGEILMLGDFINHTNFTQEELDGGFYRLKAGDWIERSIESCLPSEKTLDAYKNISVRGLSVHAELSELESLLSIKNTP